MSCFSTQTAENDDRRSGNSFSPAPADLANAKDKLRRQESNVSDAESKRMGSTEVVVTVGHTARQATGEPTYPPLYDWDLYVRPNVEGVVAEVLFHLHASFEPAQERVTAAPFVIKRRGWGTFTVQVDIVDLLGGVHRVEHKLDFAQNTETRATISVAVSPITSGSTAEGADGTTTPLARMQGVNEVGMHGHRGVGHGWRAPLLITECDAEARPGYNTMRAHEYQDDPGTLRAKVAVMAEMLRAASHPVAYTGAGISTSAGVDDYASKSKNSAATGTKARRRKKNRSGLNAEPTFAHHTLTALHRAGHLVHWVQQNHDGLPQKAGFPQQAINEIHGAWFDPSNPVVPMSGSLRDDLYAWMEREEQEADLVLTMGTSLCGMNADRMVSTPSQRCIEQGIGLGSIIIGFQRTQLDNLASLRIYGPIDHVMKLLAEEMSLDVQKTIYRPNYPAGARCNPRFHKFRVPYDKYGHPTTDGSTTLLSLDKHSRIQLTAGPGKGYVGLVERLPEEQMVSSKCAYTLRLPLCREGDPMQGKQLVNYAFGQWMVEAACRGELHMLPIVNPV